MFITCVNIAYAQVNTQSLIANLQKYSESQPQEKVHLHLDKPYYTSGDTIYLKGYIVSAEKNLPSVISRVLYVDLINPEDSIISSVILPAWDGITWGTLMLPDTLQQGMYRLRAYTNWMRNNDAQYFFDKVLPVIDVLNKRPDASQQKITQANKPPNSITSMQPDTTSAKKPIITFFPEGGNLVYGLHSKIGFKAVGSNGLDIAVEGDIFNTADEKTGSFKSGFAGIGSFEITAFSGNEYYAMIKYADGSTAKEKLPVPMQQGYVLFMEHDSSENIKLQISAVNVHTPAQLVLAAQSSHQLKYIATTTLNAGGFSGTIPAAKFPTGIVQFTLFDSLLHPLAERLMFVDHHDQLQATITPDKNSYAKREAVQLTLQAKDHTGNAVTGSFSVAVTNQSQLSYDEVNEKTILSNLLLTSDLRGYIERPNYYFINPDAEKIKALDNLLLTQGWRRFKWQDVIAGNIPTPSLKPEKNLVISGRVINQQHHAVTGGKITLLPKAGEGLILDTTIQKDGSFVFEQPEITSDSLAFTLQAIDERNKNDLLIELDTSANAPVTNFINLPDTAFFIHARKPGFLAQENMRIQEALKKRPADHTPGNLKEVVVKTKILSKVEEAVAPSANLNGPGRADQVLTYLDIRNCAELSSCLQGRLNGIIFKQVFDRESGTFKVVPFSTLGMGAPMMVLVDGMTGTALNSIPSSSVQSIEVLRTGAYLSTYGLRGSGGIILITTKRGGIDYNADFKNGQTSTLKGMLFATVPTYHISREFYTPMYDIPIATTTQDLRNPIFWKPDIVTDENGKATIHFYNADVTGIYQVIAEGISDEGKLARVMVTYEVK